MEKSLNATFNKSKKSINQKSDKNPNLLTFLTRKMTTFITKSIWVPIIDKFGSKNGLKYEK